MNLNVKTYVDDKRGYHSLVSIVPPNTNDESSLAESVVDCIFVVDTSYSMNDSAGEQAELGLSQFNVLDIAKHALQTVCYSMSESSRIAVVSFSDSAFVECALTHCTEEGKEEIIRRVMSMRPTAATNLLSGIVKAYEVAATARVNSVCSIIILTDGAPSAHYHPSRAVPGRLSESYSVAVDKMRTHCMSQSHVHPIVTCVGLGYSLDTELLSGIGELLHVPDVGDVGPFMVNFAAWISSVVAIDKVGPATNMILDVSSNSSFSIPVTNNTVIHAASVPLGSVIYDVPRHVVIRHVEPPSNLRIRLCRGVQVVAEHIATTVGGQEPDSRLEEEIFRARSVNVMETMNSTDNFKEDRLVALNTLLDSADENVHHTSLFLTLNTEVRSALSTQSEWNRWGRHYLRTFPSMLKCERRSNFRDEALQKYTFDIDGRASRMEKICLLSEETFSTLKITPSLVKSVAGMVVGTPVETSVPETFFRGGGCVHEDALMIVVRNDVDVSLPAKSVKAGDYVKTPDGISVIVCVGYKECDGGRASLAKVGDRLLITPWHPVNVDGSWIHPTTLNEPRVVPCKVVYSFVLTPPHTSFYCDDVICASLGHGLDEPVVSHEYWGTSAVLQDMMRTSTYSHGIVDMDRLRS
jgi:uncharacterized protein YegL